MLATALALAPAFADTRPQEVFQHLRYAQPVGHAGYHFFGVRLFDAALWNESGAFDWNEPFALVLTYRRSFSAEALADRSIEEMSRRGAGTVPSLRPLAARLRTCFADVAPGDRITGVSLGANRARFFMNGNERCELEWPGFRRSFFGIWLDARGRDRMMSDRLTGRA